MKKWRRVMCKLNFHPRYANIESTQSDSSVTCAVATQPFIRQLTPHSATPHTKAKLKPG